MDIQDIRRARLAQLIQERFGTQANFVEQTNENQGEISALLREKSFGEKKARKLERKCKLPAYWLDGDLAPISASPQAREVARIFDGLTDKQQEAVIGVIESYGIKVPRAAAATTESQTASLASPDPFPDTASGRKRAQSSGSS